jgi:hypothetical protein
MLLMGMIKGKVLINPNLAPILRINNNHALIQAKPAKLTKQPLIANQDLLEQIKRLANTQSTIPKPF